MDQPVRERTVRIGRSAWRYYWAGLLVLLGGPLMFFAARVVGGAVSDPGAWLLTLGAILVAWTVVCAIIAATQRATLLDLDAAEVSLRGAPWIPLNALVYGETRLVSNAWAVGLGTHKGDVVWISDAFLFGDSREVRRLAHWMAQCSSVPTAAEGTAANATKEDLLTITSGWAH